MQGHMQDEVSQARMLAEKFASEREEAMAKMNEALRLQEAEREKFAMGTAAQVLTYSSLMNFHWP